MSKTSPLSHKISNKKGLTISKPLLITIHFLLTAASSAGIYALVAQHEQQQTKAELDNFSKQASALIEHYVSNWQQQAALLAQQPQLRSAATLKAVIPVDGSVPPSLNYADQDLLNRTRVAATQPEISGTDTKAMISIAQVMPTGGYAIFNWPLAPLVQDLKQITPANIEVKFAQKLGDGTLLEVLRVHPSGNDGALQNVMLNKKNWQMSIKSAGDPSQLPLWAALIGLFGGLIPLILWALRKTAAAAIGSSKKAIVVNEDNFGDLKSLDPVAAPAQLASANANLTNPATSASRGALALDSGFEDIDEANFLGNDTDDTLNNQTASQADASANTSDELAESGSSNKAPAHQGLFIDTTPDLKNLKPVEEISKDIEFSLEEALLPDMEFNLSGPSFAHQLFRAYDIRGPIDDLSTELVSKIGRALGAHYRELDQYQVVVGYDARTSSTGYAKQIRQALVDSGLTVIDVGRVTTPLCYFAAAQHDGNAIMVTASHNPADQNGFKWLTQHQSPLPETIAEIKQRIIEENFVEGLGTIRSMSYTEDYLSLLHDDVILSQPFNISIDTMHGSAGDLALAAFKAAGCEVSSLNIEANGMFPNGAPDPSNEANLQELSNDIVISNSQLGFAFDGDGDRLVVLDSQGHVISPDQLITLFAKICLHSNPGSDIIFDAKCSRMVSKVVTQAGGRPVMVRTGNTFLRQALNDPEHQAVFAGEVSGHYFFKDHRGHGQDDGLYAALRLLEWLDNNGQTLEEALAELPQRVCTPDLYIPLEGANVSDILAHFQVQAEQLSDAKIVTIDGIRLDFDTGFGIIRPSNTGPFLTARFDADNAENLQLIRSTFARLLREHDPRIAQLILE